MLCIDILLPKIILWYVTIYFLSITNEWFCLFKHLLNLSNSFFRGYAFRYWTLLAVSASVFSYRYRIPTPGSSTGLSLYWIFISLLLDALLRFDGSYKSHVCVIMEWMQSVPKHWHIGSAYIFIQQSPNLYSVFSSSAQVVFCGFTLTLETFQMTLFNHPNHISTIVYLA